MRDLYPTECLIKNHSGDLFGIKDGVNAADMLPVMGIHCVQWLAVKNLSGPDTLIHEYKRTVDVIRRQTARSEV